MAASFFCSRAGNSELPGTTSIMWRAACPLRAGAQAAVNVHYAAPANWRST